MDDNAEKYSHDSSYKDFFSHPEMVASLLRDFVPEEFVAELDFSTLEKCSGDYVTDAHRQRHGDAVWRIRWRDSYAYILLMLEFQSQVDPWMAVRILAYTALLWQDLIKSGEIKTKDKLPPVLPIVLYNGDRPWTAATDIAKLLAPEAEHLRKYQPQQSYFILDESLVPENQLLGTGGLVAQLIRLERGGTPEEIGKIIQELIVLLGSPSYIALRRTFALWIGRVLLVRLGITKEVTEIYDLQEVGAMLETRVDEWRKGYIAQGRREGFLEGRLEGIAIISQLMRNSNIDLSECNILQDGGANLVKQVDEWRNGYIAKGRLEGKAEGIAEGKAEGKAEGTTNALKIYLSSKFGSYPQEIQIKIMQFSKYGNLESLLPHAYGAASLQEFALSVDKLLQEKSQS